MDRDIRHEIGLPRADLMLYSNYGDRYVVVSCTGKEPPSIRFGLLFSSSMGDVRSGLLMSPQDALIKAKRDRIDRLLKRYPYKETPSWSA